MTKPQNNLPSSPLPSVDRVLRHDAIVPLLERYGRSATVEIVRTVMARLRAHHAGATVAEIVDHCREALQVTMAPSQRPVFNLTGTVIHTNLGRAPLPQEAIRATVEALEHATNLEFDLSAGKRGDRTDHVRHWLCRLTGAEAASVVNNNAGAVFLALNSLALKREVPVSRGELIEIGGSFRMPDIMARAGCRLIEVGTTNRTHLADFERALGPRTALLMKVHPSNYAVEGFVASVGDSDLAALAHRHGVPYMVDLGSGTLVDLTHYGLPYEPTPMASIAAGADLVTFSGDKLLGGPQAGIIVGRADLVRKIDRNPLKRVLRLDKGRVAALEAVLRLYADPDRLAERLPTLRLLTRRAAAIEAVGGRVLPAMERAVGALASVTLEPCKSQIGSGSLPIERLESYCLVLRPPAKAGGAALARLAALFRTLPIPVIGRVEDGCLKFDLRCLEDEERFLGQLAELGI